MKLLVLAACAFTAMPSLCAADAAMPPDPLMQRLVKVPFTAAELIVRNKTEAPGLNLWRLAGELEALTTEQVRTVAFNCWRPYRRLETGAMYAATAALSLWAERDLADAAGTLMFIGSWEDMDDLIGDYDIDLEFEAGWLWAQLAQRDWKKAKALLEKMSGEESTGQFATSAAELANLTPAQAAQFVAILAPKPMEKNCLGDIVTDQMDHLAGTWGVPATRAWAKSLQPAKARKLALSIQANLEEHPLSPPPARVFSDDPLGKLRALDIDSGSGFMPFPLYRAVKALTPAEAMKLADEADAHPLPQTNRGSWLRWMLFMRAAEGDITAAARLGCGSPLGGDSLPFTEVFAQRKDVSAAMDEIGRMPDKALRAAALSGLLTHADITDPAKWLKTISSLKVDAGCAKSMFSRLGATGKGREAFELAASLHAEPAATDLAEAALDTWILTDFRGFFVFLKEKGGPDGETLALKDNIAVSPESAVDLLRAFRARDLLQDDDPVPPKYLSWSDAPWTFFAFEDLEVTFRYLERHAEEPGCEQPISWFADVAVRFEPERTVALSSRAEAAHLARERKANAGPDGDGESAQEADRFAYGSIRRRIVQFWPGKALALFAPATDREWEALCREMLDQHPQRLTNLVKKAPETVRHSLAKLLTAEDSQPLSADKSLHLTQALRAAR